MVQPHVLFIKPSWKNQIHNLEEGIYRVKLGTPTTPIPGYPLCYDHPDDQKSDFVEAFGDPKAGCSEKNPIQNAMNVEWRVMDIDNAIRDFKFRKSGQSYVLDIDLDFFSTEDPELYVILSQEQHLKYTKLLEELVGENVICHYNDPKKMDKITKLLHEIFWEKLTFMPGSKKPINLKQNSVWKKRTAKLWCDPSAAYETLINVTKLAHEFITVLTPQVLATLKDNHKFPNISCKTNNYFGVCANLIPAYYASREEILENIKYVGDFIRKFGKPAVITIARSLKGYTPPHLYPFIENNLLVELHNALDGKVQLKFYSGLKEAPTESPKMYKVPPKDYEMLKKSVLGLTKKQLKAYSTYVSEKLVLAKLATQFTTVAELEDVQVLVEHPKVFDQMLAYVKKKIGDDLEAASAYFERQIRRKRKNVEKAS